MSKRQSSRIRSLLAAAIVAALTILSAATVVLADSGGVPFPK
jgi:hypothetical protein